MTARRDPEHLIRTYLDDGPTELPDRAYDAVRSQIDHARQRVVFGPWREPRVSNFPRFAIAAVAILAVVAVGAYALPRLGGIAAPAATPTEQPSARAQPTATAQPSATAPASPPSATPSASPTLAPTPAVVPAMTQTFTSSNYGYSVGYPAGWAVEPATSLWWPPGLNTGPEDLSGYDFIVAPGEYPMFRAASAEAPDGVSVDDWSDEFITHAEAVGSCNPPRTEQSEISIDGQAGRIRECHPYEIESTVVVGRRVYVFTLFLGFLGMDQGRVLFDAFAASIDLHPSTPIATPTPVSAAPRTYVTTPFALDDQLGICMGQPGCSESPEDESIRITYTYPDGWTPAPFYSIWLASENNSGPAGAGVLAVRGGWLFDDPCRTDDSRPDISTGTTVDDFANALAEHPLLEVTDPVDVSLAGYDGKYVDLQVPSDIFCNYHWRPWEPGIYAQGAGHRWHLWILDVDGVRVVIQATDYAGTAPERQAELQAIVDSIQIEPGDVAP